MREVLVLILIERRGAGAEGLWFDSLWEIIIFHLCHARDKTKNIFLSFPLSQFNNVNKNKHYLDGEDHCYFIKCSTSYYFLHLFSKNK